MASVTYSGTFGVNVAGTNGKSATATGAPIPDGMKITSINYSIAMSCQGYSRELVWRVYWFAVGGQDGSPSAPYAETPMNDDDQVLSGSMIFSPSDVDKFKSGTITVYAKVNNNHRYESYMGAFSIVVNYEEDTGSSGDSGGDIDPGGSGSGGETYDEYNLIAAQNLKLSATKSYGEDVTLTWNYPANAGNMNSMYLHTEYSEDGETWEEVEVSIDLRQGSGAYSKKVSPPSTLWAYHRYRVETRGKLDGLYATLYSEYSDALQYVRPVLVPYTDDPIVSRVTNVKAVHMQELQTNINRIREAEGLAAYQFTAIVSGRTALADWSAHIAELRAAIDEMGLSHDAWIVFEINAPRADVLTQLRQVVNAL